MGTSFVLKTASDNMAYYEEKTHETGFAYLSYIGPPLSDDLKDKIMNIDGVEAYVANRATLFPYVNLSLFPAQNYARYQEMLEDGEEGDQPPFRRVDSEIHMSSTTLFGVQSSKWHENFLSGAFILNSGRHLDEDDVNKALISTDLADRNHLAIGDTFTIEFKEGNIGFSDTPMEIVGEQITLEIVGLFDVTFEQDLSPFTFENDLAENFIFADWTTSNQLILIRYPDYDWDNYSYGELTFFVDSPDHLEDILNEVRSIEEIDWDYFYLEVDTTSFRTSIKPLEQMIGLSSFLIIASILGVLILLYLVLHMWMEERKQEIGILMSIGLKKYHIAVQLILEGILISIIALILTFSLGRYTVIGFGRLSEEITSAKIADQKFLVRYDDYGIVPHFDKVAAEPVHLNYEISLQNIIIVILITLVITIFSVFLSFIKILHMKPKEVLSSI